MDNEGILQQIWTFLNENSEETLRKICDLKFLCSQGKSFYSFKILLASMTSSYFKDILDDSDDDIITLPNDITYEQIKSVHYCLLSNPNFSELEENLEIFKLFKINFQEPLEASEASEIEAKKTLVCGECDKTYVNLACYKNHIKLHKQELIRTLNSKKKPENAQNRPKREVQRPKRFEAENEEDYALYFEAEMKSEVYKKRRKTAFTCDICGKCFSSKQVKFVINV